MFSADVFIEVGHGPTIIDNNMLLSKVSITIPSEGIAVVHNLVLGSFSLINSGVDSIVNDQREPRYTPYHIQHRTEVAGFMTILHGDDRIYNNIFVQNCAVKDKERTAQSTNYEVVGTSPFDIFPTYDEWIANFMMGKEPDMGALAPYHFGHLPVWVGGNAYFNGATVCKHEKDMFVGKDKVTISLKDGVLKNNLSQFLGDYTTKKVVFIVGMNKICPDVDSAMKRARNVAAPINAQRFGLSTPCTKTGSCMNCKSPDTICCQILITRFSRHKDRIHVILVNDNLGF